MTRPLPCSPERLADVAREYRVTASDVEMQWCFGDFRSDLPATIEEAAQKAYDCRKRIEAVAEGLAQGRMLAARKLEKEYGFSLEAIWREKRDGDWPNDRSAAEALRARKEARRAARPWWLRWWPW